MDRRTALAEIAGYPFWYHTIDLGEGHVTPGSWDLRRVVDVLPWPDVRGKRCLDVGTFDGWFAFELEARGAAEVVAVDLDDIAQLDWPRDVRPDVRASGWDTGAFGGGYAPGRGFALAAAARGSSVRREACSVYDLTPDRVGTFDVVTCGSLLLHLRDPVRALEAIRSVCTGSFLSSERVDPWLCVLRRSVPAARLSGIGEDVQWWIPNAAGHSRMLRSAGFAAERTAPPYLVEYGRRTPPRWLDRRDGPAEVLTATLARTTRRGMLHHAVLARPD